MTLRACALVFVIVAAGCTESDPPPQFSAAAALEQGQLFRELWLKGDVAGLAERSLVPFVFRGRKWPTPDELRKNLAKQVPLLRAEIEEGANLEVYSYRDLMDGQWPRAEDVPLPERSRRLNELGLLKEGYLVRGAAPGRTGWLLVLNADAGTSLKAQGLF